MVKKRVASGHIYGQQYEQSRSTRILDELVKPSPVAFQLSANVEEHCKLTAKAVYIKILD